MLHEGCRVVGRIDKFEFVVMTYSATVAAVIYSDVRVMLGERLIGGEELKVGTRGPTVKQQQCRHRLVSVTMMTVEDLAAPREMSRVAKW